MDDVVNKFDASIEMSALLRVEERWNAAAEPLSPSNIAKIYIENALFFGGLPDHYVGRAEVERYFTHYVGMLSSISMKFREQHFTSLQDAILVQGFVDFIFGLPDGRTTTTNVRATLVLVQQDNDWSIMLHHFSPPPDSPPVPL